jgi:phenylacetate-CoA ligase
VYRSPGSIIRENAYVWYFRMMHDWNIGDPIVSMRGKLDNKTLSHYNKAENVLYLSIYMLSAANIKKYVELIEQFKPKAISTLPSTLYTMVNLMDQANLQLHIPKVFTASSTLYPFQREKMERILNTKVIDWYGNAERTITLGQCAHGNYHEFPMYSYNEFKKNGVITTGLTNRSFPLIRYYVDDVFHLKDGPCECGREKAISYIQGRFEDAVLLSDGTLVNGLGIAFQGIKHLQYAQIIQEKVNSIQVNLVTAPGFSKEDEGTILKRLRQRMNDTATIAFNSVSEDDIIRNPSGKFTLIISKIDMARLPDALRTFDAQPTEVV